MGQSIVKPFEEESRREDRIRIDLQNNLFAVADGAGGEGLFAGDWAQCLLNALPNKPIQTFDKFKEWYNTVSPDFYELHHRKVVSEIPDLREKFEKEGSLSTLVVLWFVPEESRTYSLSYGDSALFLSRGNHFWSSIDYADYLDNPRLLSCIDEPVENGVRFESGAYSEFGTYMLCSDTLAKYILAAWHFTSGLQSSIDTLKTVEDDYVSLSQYTIDLRKAGMQELDFKNDILSKLWDSLSNELDFKNYIYALKERKLIAHDDYSLIMIK